MNTPTKVEKPFAWPTMISALWPPLLAGALLSVGVALVVAWGYGLQGDGHALRVSMLLHPLASMGGAYLGAFYRSNLIALALRISALLLGLTLGVMLLLQGAGFGFVLAGLVWFGLSVFFGLQVSLAFSAKSFIGVALAAALALLFAGGPFWTNRLLVEGIVSADQLGWWVITQAPSLRMLKAGLDIEIFGGHLYLERGYVLKDFGPHRYYQGLAWLLPLLGAGIALVGIGLRGLAATLSKQMLRRRARVLGFEEQDEALSA